MEEEINLKGHGDPDPKAQKTSNWTMAQTLENIHRNKTQTEPQNQLTLDLSRKRYRADFAGANPLILISFSPKFSFQFLLLLLLFFNKFIEFVLCFLTKKMIK